MSHEEISNDTLNERQGYLNSILEFIDSQKQKLSKVLDRLDLSTEELMKSEEKQACPYNKNHIVPEKSFKKHTQACKLLTAGYQKDELPALLQNVDFCYENKDSTMKIDIDENLLNKIIWDHCVQNGQVYTGHRSMPASHIDENINLTQEDKLAIYHYVVNKSHEAGKVIPVDRDDDLLTTDWGSLVKKGLLDEQNNKQYASKLEQLAALRDLKRRRQSYRAKNVHITKKSYTEIIREVISNQMEILAPERKTRSETSPSNEDVKDRDTYESRSGDRYRDQGGSKDRHNRAQDDDGDKYERRSGSRCHRRWEDSAESSRDRFRYRETSRDRSRDRSRSRLRRRGQDSPQLGSSDRSRQSTEADSFVQKEIKQEAVSADLPSIHSTREEESRSENVQMVDAYEEVERHRSKLHSDSDSDRSERRHSKHKKSKHKKKHSKKHKRKD